MCGDGAVQPAEATAPQRDRYEIKITEASDGHRKNWDLGNGQPNWKRSEMGRRRNTRSQIQGVQLLCFLSRAVPLIACVTPEISSL